MPTLRAHPSCPPFTCSPRPHAPPRQLCSKCWRRCDGVCPLCRTAGQRSCDVSVLLPRPGRLATAPQPALPAAPPAAQPSTPLPAAAPAAAPAALEALGSSAHSSDVPGTAERNLSSQGSQRNRELQFDSLLGSHSPPVHSQSQSQSPPPPPSQQSQSHSPAQSSQSEFGPTNRPGHLPAVLPSPESQQQLQSPPGPWAGPKPHAAASLRPPGSHLIYG